MRFLPLLIKFEPIEFINNLKYMALGMLGIFIVIGILAGVTIFLINFFKDPVKK